MRASGRGWGRGLVLGLHVFRDHPLSLHTSGLCCSDYGSQKCLHANWTLFFIFIFNLAPECKSTTGLSSARFHFFLLSKKFLMKQTDRWFPFWPELCISPSANNKALVQGPAPGVLGSNSTWLEHFPCPGSSFRISALAIKNTPSSMLSLPSVPRPRSRRKGTGSSWQSQEGESQHWWLKCPKHLPHVALPWQPAYSVTGQLWTLENLSFSWLKIFPSVISLSHCPDSGLRSLILTLTLPPIQLNKAASKSVKYTVTNQLFYDKGTDRF